MSQTPGEPIVLRCYRVLLRAYPREFLRAHGDDMEQVFRDAWRDVGSGGGPLGRFLFLAGMGLDVVRYASLAWAESSRGASQRRPAPRDGVGAWARASNGQWLGGVSRDIAYAGRSLRRRPGFTAVAVLSLALGIGANLAVFNIFERLVLAKLPVKDPDTLHNLVIIQPSRRYDAIPYPKFVLLRDNVEIFDEVFGWGGAMASVSAAGSSRVARVNGVTGNYFEALGVRAEVGRVLTSQDDREGADNVAVISHQFWRQAFASDPSVVGRIVRADYDADFVVVGVAPPEFVGTEPSAPPAVYVPIAGYRRVAPNVDGPGNFWFHVMGRLSPDTPVATAQAVLHERWPELDEPSRLASRRNARDVVLLEDGSQGYSVARVEFSRAVLVVMGLVAAVFLIACANLATLLFIRGAGRMREMTIRTAIGASRPQLVLQWMTECMMVAALGGAVGLAAASWITELLLLFLKEADRPLLRFQAGPTVILASLALTLAAGLISGLLPGLRATGAKTEAALKGHSSAVTERRGSLSEAVLSLQLAASFVLIVGGALFVRTLWNLNASSGGFARGEVVYAVPDFSAAHISLPFRDQVVADVLARLRRSPLISAASMGDPPLVFDPGTAFITGIPNYEMGPDEDNSVPVKSVSPGYFHALGVDLLVGREFAEGDRPSGDRRFAIIDRTLAERFFPGRNPVGERILNRQASMEIIGVVPDLGVLSMRGTEGGVLYEHWVMNNWNRAGGSGAGAVLARPAPGVATAAVESEMRSAFAAVAEGLNVNGRRPLMPVEIDRLETAIQGTLARDRLLAQLSAIFAVIGIMLAAMGLYASMAYSVTARTRELGIRRALGATSVNVAWTVLQRAMVVTGIGVVVGLPAALLGGRLISPLLFEVSPFDPWILGGTSTLLMFSGILAGWWPARRALRLDPSRTLRFEQS